MVNLLPSPLAASLLVLNREIARASAADAHCAAAARVDIELVIDGPRLHCLNHFPLNRKQPLCMRLWVSRDTATKFSIRLSSLSPLM
jgi:hypothetical protein